MSSFLFITFVRFTYEKTFALIPKIRIIILDKERRRRNE